MSFDLSAALKVIAETSKSGEIRGALHLAAGELRRLQEIEAAVQYCVVAEYENKAAAWVRVKKLCRVCEKE
jgi:hypothetical protein